MRKLVYKSSFRLTVDENGVVFQNISSVGTLQVIVLKAVCGELLYNKRNSIMAGSFGSEQIYANLQRHMYCFQVTSNVCSYVKNGNPAADINLLKNTNDGYSHSHQKGS